MEQFFKRNGRRDRPLSGRQIWALLGVIVLAVAVFVGCCAGLVWWAR